MKRGLELEYWMIDEEGALTTPSRSLAELSFVEREAHPSLIEIKTDPHESQSGLRAELCDRLDRTLQIARADGHRLAPVGTALEGVDSVEGACRESSRTDAQRRLLGDAFRHALACAGTHVHFEQVDPAAQLNALLALDPALALLNTTPYSDGRRIATCARPYVYRRRCYAEYPALGQLWQYAESAEEWRQRLADTYERFTQEAMAAGVSEQIVEDCFDEATAVWGPVRLRDDLSTVEWRAPDAGLPSQALQLVGDVTPLVERASELDRPSFERLQQLTDAMIARGLTDRSVRQYLSGVGFDLEAYDPVGQQIDGRRQLSSRQARQIRRQLATRLEADLATLRTDSSGSDEPEPRAVASV